jgi:bacillithiol biosynthesis cysteine-adding enzyme BshC
MPDRPEATLSSGVVRGAVDFRRCPWVRPLVNDYVNRFSLVAPLFSGNPSEPSAWNDAIVRVGQAPQHRSVVARAVTAQQERRDAPAQARRAAAQLTNDSAVAVVTGQQAGVFGGPLYSLLKAITAIQLARRVQDEHGVPVVPVFWVDSEDHDWEEIRRATVLDRDFHAAEIVLRSMPGAGAQPVGSLVFDGGIEQAISALADKLPPTDFTDGLISALHRRYRPGAALGSAFAGWIEDVLGRHGLVVFEAADPHAKPAVADLFARELQAPERTVELVRTAGATLDRLGHAPQVDPSGDSANLFYLDAAGRRPIRRKDGQYVIGDDVRTPRDLTDEALTHPDHFSPNVVLRPIVQDRLFPTICYIAGPSELAYQAQLREVYREFGVASPLLYPRASATILDSASARFLERHALAFETLQAQDESVLNHLLERHLPPSIERTLHETERQLADQTRALRDTVSAIDPTLTGAVDTTVDRIRDTLKTLQNKIVQASKRKDDTLRRQFIRTRDLAFPGGHPQERTLSFVSFINRYGPAFAERLLEELPSDTSRHYLLAL